jgi:hypothetical protein
MPISQEKALLAQQIVLDYLREIGVQAAAGLTDVDGSWAVKVNLDAPLTHGQTIPCEVEGVPVQLDIVGATRALSR